MEALMRNFFRNEMKIESPINVDLPQNIMVKIYMKKKNWKVNIDNNGDEA